MVIQGKNYLKPGGKELVIGGKLTILPGAVVTGLTAEHIDGEIGERNPPAAQPVGVIDYQPDVDNDVNSVAGLRGELNALLKRLRAAGLMEAAPAAPDPDENPEPDA